MIIALGNKWLQRNVANQIMRPYYTSAAMRLAARLLLNLRAMTGTNESLTAFISPIHFTNVASAALKVARQDEEDENNLQAPSNALKLKYDLQRMGTMKWCQAIQERNKEKKADAKDLFRDSWRCII